MITTIPLNQFTRTAKNMRSGAAPVDDLVAGFRSRMARGLDPLMQNIGAYLEAQPKKAKTPALYAVHLGDRRYRGLLVLAEAGEIAADYPVPVKISDEAEAVDESIAENEQRLPPHPADRYDAFRKLSETGVSNDEISLRYGYPVDQVARILKLGRVAPSIMDLFRADEIDLKQMMALTITDDIEAQEAALLNPTGGYREAYYIRSALENAVVRGDSSLAKFVGAEAYTAAGGTIASDLFTTDERTYFHDRPLLVSLAASKLAEVAQDLLVEGWAWADGMVEFPHADASSYQRVYPERAPLSEEDAERVAAIKAEIEALTADVGEDDELNEQIWAQESALEAEAKALVEAMPIEYDANVLEFAGAIVTIGRDGLAKIERGLIRAADCKAYNEMVAAMAPATDADAGEGAEGAAPSGPKKRADGLSGSHVENLTAHRTLAMRAAIYDHPHAARALLLHSLLTLTHYKANEPKQRVLLVSGPTDWRGDAAMRFGDDLKTSPALALVDERRERAAAILPPNVNDLFAFLLAQPGDVLDELTPLAVDTLIYGVEHKDFAQSNIAVFEELADAVDLDMSKTWAATEESYLGRVSGALIKSAVAEACDAASLAKLDGLKKGPMVKKAEELLAETDWLPPVLRSHKPRPEPVDLEAVRAAKAERLAQLAANMGLGGAEKIAAE